MRAALVAGLLTLAGCAYAAAGQWVLAAICWGLALIALGTSR